MRITNSMNKEITNQPRAIKHSLPFGLSGTPLSIGATLFILIMKEIKLTQEQVALVDDWNYDWLNSWKWFANKNKNTYYARRRNGNKYISMHRLIMNTPRDKDVDHEDHNGLNCQEHNMRNCTNKQNQANRISHGKSKYLGVYYNKTKGYTYIRAQIQGDGKNINLGQFKTEEDAARAYDAAAKLLFGEYACLNFKEKP